MSALFLATRPNIAVSTRQIDAARLAASCGDASVAKNVSSQLQITPSEMDIYEAILRSVPQKNMPTKVAFGDLTFGLVTPAKTFDCIYDPLRGMISDPLITEYITDVDPESSGGITSSLAASPGYSFKVRAIRLRYDTDPDQSGADDALETVTYNPEYKNTELAGAVQTTTTSELNIGDVTATNTFKFRLPATKTGGVYLHFASREDTLAACVPDRAMISSFVASPGELIAAQRTIAPVTSLLVSSSAIRKTSSVLSPGLPDWEEYAVNMLSLFYRPL